MTVLHTNTLEELNQFFLKGTACRKMHEFDGVNTKETDNEASLKMLYILWDYLSGIYKIVATDTPNSEHITDDGTLAYVGSMTLKIELGSDEYDVAQKRLLQHKLMKLTLKRAFDNLTNADLQVTNKIPENIDFLICSRSYLDKLPYDFYDRTSLTFYQGMLVTTTKSSNKEIKVVALPTTEIGEYIIAGRVSSDLIFVPYIPYILSSDKTVRSRFGFHVGEKLNNIYKIPLNDL